MRVSTGGPCDHGWWQKEEAHLEDWVQCARGGWHVETGPHFANLVPMRGPHVFG